MNNYKDIVRYESEGSPSVSIGIKVCLDYHRELTEDEKHFIYNKIDEFIKLVRNNTARLTGVGERERLKEIFKNLFPPDQVVYIEEIPNEYCSEYCCVDRPWYIFTTKYGRIKIGWRKRVINIDWSSSDIKRRAIDLFSQENTTIGEKYIHAWGYDKAKEYLTKLLK